MWVNVAMGVFCCAKKTTLFNDAFAHLNQVYILFMGMNDDDELSLTDYFKEKTYINIIRIIERRISK
jgi:hypothetical protein